MSLTDREAYLELRARYLRLLGDLRRTRDHNPETLDAFERILQSDNTHIRPPIAILPSLEKQAPGDLRQHAA